MAITKIIKIKSNVKAAIKYVRNPEKTNEQLLVSYDGCDEKNVELCFKMALSNKRQNRNSDGVMAYHFIQSFAPTDEISPETAHEIGMKFMKNNFDGKYSFVCATHIDKGHIHNHFIMCSAEKGMTGRKLVDDLSLLHKMQKISDELCREYGLSVIDRKHGKGKSYKEWLEDKESPSGSKKTQLRKLMDKTIADAGSFEDFLKKLEAQGIVIAQGNSKKYGTVTKYRFADEQRFHRGYSLGNFYTDENIKKRIKRRQDYLENQSRKATERKDKKKAAYDAMTPGERKLDKSKLKISSMRKSQDNISHENIGLVKWTNVQNARRFQQIQAELHDKYGISYTELSGHIRSRKADGRYREAIIRKKKSETAELRQLINDCTMYKKLKIYSINENKAHDQESYYEKHDQELNAFAAAKYALESHGVDLAAVTDRNIELLKKRLEEAEIEILNMMEQLQQNEQEIKELEKYQKEIDIYFGRNPEESL